MSRSVRDQLWIVLVSGLVFVTNLAGTGLWDLDEPLYASTAREMMQRGDWVVPMYNGEPFFDKPPLMFWLMIAGYKLFGVGTLGARFCSPLFGIGTALVTYHLGRRLFCREVGLWGGLIMASIVLFTVSARAATVDAALTFVTSAGLLTFSLAAIPSESSTPRRLPAWLAWTATYALFGVAVLAKGPVGLLLPAATIGLYLLIVGWDKRSAVPPKLNPNVEIQNPRQIQNSMAERLQTRRFRLGGLAGSLVCLVRNIAHAIWQMRPLTALAVVCVVALPWYVLVGLRTHGLWLEQFFAKYNLGPFVKPFMGHRGPFFFHFVVVFVGLFPWSVFLGPTLVHWVRQLRKEMPSSRGWLFLACWAGVWFVFWSICSSKLPHYVLPAYPALALATAGLLHDWLAEPSRFQRWWGNNAGITLMAAGIAICIALPIVAAIYTPGEEIIGLVGLPLVLGGAACWWFARRAERLQMLRTLLATSVCFIVAVAAWGVARIDRHQASRSLVAEIRSRASAPTMAGYRFLRASLVFYAGDSLRCYEDPAAAHEFLAHTPQPYLFASRESAEELQAALPGQLRVVARHPEPFDKGEVVVLTRADNLDVATSVSPLPKGEGQGVRAF